MHRDDLIKEKNARRIHHLRTVKKVPIYTIATQLNLDVNVCRTLMITHDNLSWTQGLSMNDKERIARLGFKNKAEVAKAASTGHIRRTDSLLRWLQTAQLT